MGHFTAGRRAVLTELSFRDLVPAIWLPAPESRQERERSSWRLHLVERRSILKNRVDASLIAFGHQGPDDGPSRTSGRGYTPAWISPSRGLVTSGRALS